MLHTVRIAAYDLGIGMYVSALDRPWLEVPFLTQGFVLESQADIDRVRQYCEYVYVDTVRSRMGSGTRRLEARAAPATQHRAGGGRGVPIEKIFKGHALQPYQDNTTWQEEHARAHVALDSLTEDISQIFDHVSVGGTLDVIRLKNSVAPIISSIGRNPDACLWLARLKQHDHYSYRHSLSAAVWAVALGRQLGMQRLDLRSLAIGAMLMDVGKLRLAPELLQADRSLDDDEVREMREHVANGIELIHGSGLMNQNVADMVAHHHERFDGSGYPNGLAREQIPAFARIAGIVDTYDALTSERSYASAVSPSEAVRILYQSRDAEFQSELVEAFIQAVGIYPAGTVVELSSGEIGVVIAECRTRRLLPKVTVMLDADKRPLAQPKLIDLLFEDGEAQSLRIVRSLTPGAYDIDLTEADAFSLGA